MIRPSSPPLSPIFDTTLNIGMRIDWYGMNIPNRIRGKTKSAPGKRHLARTKPLAAPSIAEIRLAGIASTKLLRKPSSMSGHTLTNVSTERLVGSSHICTRLALAGSLNPVTTSTYTGSRKKHAKKNSAAYLPNVTYGAHFDRGLRRGRAGASAFAAGTAAAGGAGVVLCVILAA